MRTQGQILKTQGQQLALFNAGKWSDEAIDKLRAFCKARKDLEMPEFRFEEFRQVAESSGWPLPHHSNAWGALPRLAVKHNLIRPTGRYEKATSVATHAHPVAVWIAI
jgi:hypothetical protein